MIDGIGELKEIVKEKFENWENDIEDDDVIDFSQYDLKTYLDGVDSFYLYRYFPDSYYSIRNLETETIHLSESGIMNDIYEALPSGEFKNIHQIDKQLYDLAYLSCFTERNNNLLMWSHYANSHRGFCIEYELKQFLIDNKDIRQHLFPVIYMKKRPIYRDINSLIESHFDLRRAYEDGHDYVGREPLDDILPLCMIKSMDWSYEEEWRFIYTKKQLYDNNCEFNPNISLPCITNIYLGYRIEKSFEENIIEIVQRKNQNGRKISVYKEKLDEEGYEVLFDKIL